MDRVVTVANAARAPADDRDDPGRDGRPGGDGRTRPAAAARRPRPGACASPRLKVKAAWRDPRVRGVRLVLRAGRRYPFAGRLTCLRDGRRVPARAARGSCCLQKRDGLMLRRRSVRVRADGRFALRVKARTRRTLVFRLRTGGRTVADRAPARRRRPAGARAVTRRRHAAALAAALALALPGAAGAQDTDVGGEVEETLALGLEPVSGFETFPAGPGTETLAIDAEVTSTGAQAVLDVEDEAAPGSRAAGRMRGGAGLLDAPLEGRVVGAFQPLDALLAEPLAVVLAPGHARARADRPAPAHRRGRAAERDLREDPPDHLEHRHTMKRHQGAAP